MQKARLGKPTVAPDNLACRTSSKGQRMKTFRDMTPARLQELVGRFPRLRIAVIGDFFLDKYLDIDRRWPR